MRTLVSAALLTAAVPASAAVQFVNAGLNGGTYGYIADSTQAQSSSDFDATLALRDLATDTARDVAGPGAADTLALSHAATVDFRGASRFTLAETSAITFNLASPGVGGYGQVGTNFYYNFTTDRRVSILIDYSSLKSVAPAPLFGVNGDPARIFISRTGVFPPLFQFAAAPNTTGQFTATLGAGSYNLGLLTVLNGGPGLPPTFGGASGITAITGSGLYDVRISAVPEPATWAMLIAGFALVGTAARRRAGDIAARAR